jgi:hypothetical protein
MEATTKKNILLFCGGLLSGITITSLFFYFKPKKTSGFDATFGDEERYNNMIANSSGGLRPSCLKCVRKHISQAIVLLSEKKKGYPEHFWIAMGHLGEAEDESIKAYPELANQIRDARETLIAGGDANLTSFYKIIDNMK